MDALLCALVRGGRYSAAERLRLKILGNALPIQPAQEYADVALACLRNRRLSGGTGRKMAEFETWMHLVPDRQQASGCFPFDRIVDELILRGSVRRFRPFFTQTMQITAYKGYAHRHFLSLARPILIHASAPPPLDSLLHVEHAATRYEQLYQIPATPVASFVRSSLIQLFLERGWPHISFRLLSAPRSYPLPDEIYQLMLDELPDRKDSILKIQTNAPWSAVQPLFPTTYPPLVHPPH